MFVLFVMRYLLIRGLKISVEFFLTLLAIDNINSKCEKKNVSSQDWKIQNIESLNVAKAGRSFKFRSCHTCEKYHDTYKIFVVVC